MKQLTNEKIDDFLNKQNLTSLLGALAPKININQKGLRHLVYGVQFRLEQKKLDRKFASEVLQAVIKIDKVSSDAKWKALRTLLKAKIDVDDDLFGETLGKLKANQLERYVIKHIDLGIILPYLIDLYRSKRYHADYSWLQNLLPMVINLIRPDQLDKPTLGRLREYLQEKHELFKDADFSLIDLALKSEHSRFGKLLEAISNQLSNKKEKENRLKQKIRSKFSIEANSSPDPMYKQVETSKQLPPPESTEILPEPTEVTIAVEQNTEPLPDRPDKPQVEGSLVLSKMIHQEIADLKQSIKPALIQKDQKDILSRQKQIAEQIRKLENWLKDGLELIHRKLDNQRKTIDDRNQTITNLNHAVDNFHNEFDKIHARFDEFDRKTLEEVGRHKHRAEVADQDVRLAETKADETLKTFRYQLGRRLLPSLSEAMKPEFAVHNVERGELVLDRLREILDVMREEGIIE